MTSLGWLRSGRARWVAAAVGAVAVSVVVLASGREGGADASDVPTYLVERGEFTISHFEAGEIRAAQSEKISAPRVRGNLKIVYLWPEGERIDVGDLILQFDRSEHEKWVKDEKGSLEKARADLDRDMANQAQRLAELELRIEQRRASLDLAKLHIQKSEYASPIEQEQRTINLERAERDLKQAIDSVEARKIVNRVEKQNLELRVSHREGGYEKVLKDYNRLTVHATKPGIVVYEVIRKRGGNRRGKVTKGDVVWGGVSLLSLPDLSEMQVHTQVGEMDIEKIEPGQKVLIRLEAFPGPVFHGEVTRVSPMASEMEEAPNIHIFEVVIDIDERDDRLYPGMSAAVEIIVESFPDALFIPLSAVRHAEGGAVVYRARGSSSDPVEVTLGKRNNVSVLVESGLEEGDRVIERAPVL